MKLIIWDFSRTLLFPKAIDYIGGLNTLYDKNKGLGFYDLFVLNSELLDYLKSINEKTKSIIFTTGNVQKAPEIAKRLKGLFVGIENVESVGFGKDDPKSYSALCDKYGVKPDDVLFVDDQDINLETAKSIGIKTFKYRSNTEIINKINALL